jgi:predicted 3-demethylubiquinone-9 3-methyltransferase (glyoxalase superfamily)
VFGGSSRVVSVANYPESAPGKTGTPMVVEFELDGQRFVAIQGGPQFKFSEAISLQIECETQDEIDRYWEVLTADGGEEGPCGWLKDKYGLSWQVTPKGMDAMFSGDPERADRAMKAVLEMRKLDIAAINAAADGVPTAS